MYGEYQIFSVEADISGPFGLYLTLTLVLNLQVGGRIILSTGANILLKGAHNQTPNNGVNHPDLVLRQVVRLVQANGLKHLINLLRM